MARITDVKIFCTTTCLPGDYHYDERIKEFENQINNLVRSGYKPLSIAGSSGDCGDIKGGQSLCVIMVKEEG